MADVNARPRRGRDRLAFWALAGVALFVAHDAIYLAQIGPGQALVAALRTAGHGYWGWASLGLAAVASIAAVGAWLRMRRLRRRASALGAKPRPDVPFARRFASTWWRLALVVAIGFVVQENAEHLVSHGHAPGSGALLGPESPLALPVIGLISTIAAAVATLVAGAQEALVVAIEVALRRLMRAPRIGLRRPASILAGIGSVLAHPGAGRAPPTRFVPST